MKLCIIYNAAQKYRERIFSLIDDYYDCDWYFGHTKTDIKEMDTSVLKHVTYYKIIGNNKISWQRSIIKLLFNKKYTVFLMLAESRNLTIYVLLFLLRFFPNKKIYLWTHGLYGKESKTETKLKLWIYRHSTGVFLYGNYAKKLLIQKGFPANKLFVIHNSLFYERQKAIRDNIKPSNIYTDHFSNNNPVIIFIGRLTKVKRLDMLIDAVTLLKQRGCAYNIVFIGDGEMRQDLECLVAKKNLTNNVWFFGACYDEQTNAELIYNADLCVAPGNVGLTAMHTMVFGCPVITHDDFKWQMPEFEAITKGITGDFFRYGNIDSLAETINNWLLSKRNKREEVRQNCFKEIDNNWNPKFQMEIFKEHLK